MTKQTKIICNVEALPEMHAFSFLSIKSNPEEDAINAIFSFIQRNNLKEHSKSLRIFGRNVYLTQKPKPRGYQVILVVPHEKFTEFKEEQGITKITLAACSFALLNSVSLTEIPKGWKMLWKWVDKNNYTRMVPIKEEYGWVLGWEEITNWMETADPRKWIFKLWAPLQV